MCPAKVSNKNSSFCDFAVGVAAAAVEEEAAAAVHLAASHGTMTEGTTGVMIVTMIAMMSETTDPTGELILKRF